MKLKHIALNIQRKEELKNFYENILGFHLVHQYELNAAFAQKIFGIEIKTQVFIYSNFTLDLELFILPEKTNHGFAHVCVETENRDIVEERCKKGGYQIIKIEREEKEDLLFIIDKSGNKFELKNW